MIAAITMVITRLDKPVSRGGLRCNTPPPHLPKRSAFNVDQTKCKRVKNNEEAAEEEENKAGGEGWLKEGGTPEKGVQKKQGGKHAWPQKLRALSTSQTLQGD